MRSFGRGGMLVAGLVAAVTAVPANAGYVLSLSGPATVDPGQSFEVTATMTGSPSDSFDIHGWNVRVTGPRALTYSGYTLNPTFFATGNADDNSSPKGAAVTGNLPSPVPITNGLYAATPGIADVHFEGLTLADAGGASIPFSGSGNLVTLRLQMPSDAVPNQEVYDLGLAVDFFNLGFDEVAVQTGGAYRVSVVPEPATLVLLGLGGLLAIRRRFAA